MTAEIAILNKTAVALAADSAVTISAGTQQHKIFDSADKLFELTRGNAIGIMINSNMNFLETPLPVLIKRYREAAQPFATVRAAADDFLAHLNAFVQASPPRIEETAISTFAERLFKLIEKEVRDGLAERVLNPNTNNLSDEFANDADHLTARIPEIVGEILESQLAHWESWIHDTPEARFVGTNAPALSPQEAAQVQRLAAEILPMASPQLLQRALALINSAMCERAVPLHPTGLVIAGFGTDELFPTLIAFELHGSVGGHLKFVETDFVDIDRDGERAKVLPFAQREMVERFLYGLDSDIEEQITGFCEQAAPRISNAILDRLDMEEEDKAASLSDARQAEQEFIAGLREHGFQAFRSRARRDIEDMVEFMPKPEMARMAEALVNLTSMKRRVSRGSETVGGPVDVAVISKAEGFVWVARKHYFPPELNSRYFERMRAQA